jgi:hypothetical protein
MVGLLYRHKWLWCINGELKIGLVFTFVSLMTNNNIQKTTQKAKDCATRS